MDKRSMLRPMSRQATIICLHASGSSGGQWSALRAQLEPDVQVLTPDFHGHGAGPAYHGFDEDIVAADAARIARLAGTVPGEVHLGSEMRARVRRIRELLRLALPNAAFATIAGMGHMGPITHS